ncbi:MauE/DoxX family redox-associated membrane protein [Pedobacter sp. MC2016-24]|uniref:MauE/DoxX family redox-associated membrane protein n=1 Tax=Pedobacter sp. MC2016-24 TaxID=2780090 RepID=UPI001882FFC4|nr:MauE/DoxX family redox-associated membrane protein [Pedobacter sp. MC2016-24]MBE9601865.1 hypothetical protein [Pedobacter sp. MC2016-24]
MIRSDQKNRVLSVRHLFVQTVASLYILLFLYAATSKLADFGTFQLQMRKSPFITAYAAVLAWLVPMVEIGIAVLLIFPKTILPGLFASFGLMTLFSLYIFGILHFSQEIPCNCGGIISAMSWDQHLAFNCVFLLLAIIAIVLKSDPVKITDLKKSS